MNIKNSKKVKIRTKLQTITDAFEQYHYDMETISDEWIIHFADEKIKFMIEISSIDENINNFKIFYDDEWLIYTESTFDEIMNVAKNKIKELYG